MKKSTFFLACMSLVLVFSTSQAHAAERKTVFNTEKIKYEEGTGSERCSDRCGRRSGPDVKALLSRGWKIVSSSPKQVIGEQYWYAPCNNCKPHGCICIGKEYVLEKEEQASKVEAKSTVIDVPGGDNRTVPNPPDVGTSMDELDHLKKENEKLKQENAFLKQENEALRNQLEIKPK